MLLKYSLVLRLLARSVILIVLADLIDRVLKKYDIFQSDWEWVVAICIILAFIVDKISIERKHTLVFINREHEALLAEWLDNKGFQGFRLKAKRSFYCDKAEKWYERNDFVRITRLANKLKIKMSNELAEEFEVVYTSFLETLQTK